MSASDDGTAFALGRLMTQLRRSWTISGVLVVALGLLAGCMEEGSDGGIAVGGSASSGGQSGGWTNSGMAGSTEIGGSGGTGAGSCSSGVLPRLTYECAGFVSEEAAVDARWAMLQAQHGAYACGDGYGYPYHDGGTEPYSTGGAATAATGASAGSAGADWAVRRLAVGRWEAWAVRTAALIRFPSAAGAPTSSTAITLPASAMP